jgi:hypothetical protein
MAPVRLAELLGRLSLAFDITNDSPFGKAVRSVVLAVELGARSGANAEELRDTYWIALLGYLGCTGFAHDEGLMGAGDDRSVRNAMSLFSIDEPLKSTLGVVQRIAPDTSVGRRLRLVGSMMSDRTLMERFQHAMCDASIRLAEIVGAGPRILSALGQLCERWDGRGAPGLVHGEGLVLPMRLQQIGHVVEIAHQRGGRDAAVDLARRRGGRQFDPRLARLVVAEQKALFDALEDPRIFERFLQTSCTASPWASSNPSPWPGPTNAGSPTWHARSPFSRTSKAPPFSAIPRASRRWPSAWLENCP